MLFLGHSTSGKSTIVRMLAEEFPTLADDAVFVARGATAVGGGGRRFRFGQGWGVADWQASVRSVGGRRGVPVRDVGGCTRRRT
jgi:energy-coupling factor transporter ATP-binding protein EcfA2